MVEFVRIELEGQADVIRTLEKAKVRMSDFADAFARIGAAIKRDAIPLTPVLTGRLVRTIRTSKAKTRATVRAGNNRMPPYAGVIHYGGYHNIEPHPFLTTALAENKGTAKSEIEKEIADIIDRLDLGTFRV